MNRIRRAAAALLSTLLASSGCLSIIPAMAPKAQDVEKNLSADFPYASRFVEVHGANGVSR